MSFNPDSEDTLERNTVRLFEELGWESANCYHEVCGANSTLGRETTEEVVLEWRLKEALEKLNPGVPPLALDIAVAELTKDRRVLSPVRANQEVYKLLKDGVKVSYRAADDNETVETVKMIDWERPGENDFFLASQFWISGEYGRKRADLIGFVNGIPLLFIELKTSHKSLENAFNYNLSDYRDTIPQVFSYNAVIILSNGSKSRIGSMTAGWEHFAEWKKINDEGEEGRVSLETMIRGVCEISMIAKLEVRYTCALRKMDESVNPVSGQTGKGQNLDELKRARELLKADEKAEALERRELAIRREMAFRRDTTEWLIANSLGMDPSQAILHRYIPTEIYVATTAKQSKENYEIAKAFSKLLEAAGFEPVDDSIPTFGSMHWRRVHRTKSRKSAAQLDDRLSLVQLALTNAFRELGANVDVQPEDRAAMERVEAEHKADLKKISAETDLAKAETEKAKAETERARAETKKVKLEAIKTLSELAHTFAKVIVKASAGFAIVIGTLHMSATPLLPPISPGYSKPAIIFKIESHRMGPNDAKEVSGGVWLRTPEKHEAEEGEEHDPLDSD